MISLAYRSVLSNISSKTMYQGGGNRGWGKRSMSHYQNKVSLRNASRYWMQARKEFFNSRGYQLPVNSGRGLTYYFSSAKTRRRCIVLSSGKP